MKRYMVSVIVVVKRNGAVYKSVGDGIIGVKGVGIHTHSIFNEVKNEFAHCVIVWGGICHVISKTHCRLGRRPLGERRGLVGSK
jgi:hypothetical protein